MAHRIKYLLITIFSLFHIVAYSQSLPDNENIQHYEGFFNFHYLEDQDEIFMEVNSLETPFLYVSSLSEGVGSNDLLLDRGQIGGSRIVQFKKAGNKLLLIQPNLKYRAITANPLEKKSIEEAFAKSVLFGFPIIEKTASGYLINLTPFLMQDTHGVSEVLQEKNQGSYHFSSERSALNLNKTRAFPKNVDFDILITLTGNPKASEIKSVTPDAKYVTVYQHHSFVELPDEGFQPRKYHPNSGGIPLSFFDYSAPIEKTMEVQYAIRHRLQKKNPSATLSEAIEPIVYYLDNGTPEPVRTALLEGASWWNEAFESIGYRDAFQMKVLPDAVDPLDVRYNVIQWVHRSTRGWSYGSSVVDPRKGEIIKGHVSLGSLRVRQDFMIAQALSKAPYEGENDKTPDLLKFALDRIKQLSAHEVGHTLGFRHNFAASIKDRASVMDYPHPWVTLKNGDIDYSNAYAEGIGAWDKVTVAYVYGDGSFEVQRKALMTAFADGHRFVSDADARPAGGANAYGHLWDNGSDPVSELNNVIAVRKKAINQFGINNIKDRASFGDLEDLFALLYFYHRYQTEATVKFIGGLDYGYALKSETTEPILIIKESAQRNALKAVLATIDAGLLAVPKDKVQLFSARSYGDRGRESFNTNTGPSFDPMSATITASDFTISFLLHPERVARLINQKALNPSQLGFQELLENLMDASLRKTYEDKYLAEVQESINSVVLSNLMGLAQNPNVLRQIKDQIDDNLISYMKELKKEKARSPYENGRIRLIENYLENPDDFSSIDIPNIPDGSPIGLIGCSYY